MRLAARERVRRVTSLDRVPSAIEPAHVVRAGTLLATLVLVSSFAFVLRDIVATVGSPRTLMLVVIGSLVAATVLWPVVTLRRAVRVAGLAFVGAMLIYGLSVPVALRPSFAVQGTLELVTGRSALWIVNVELWALLVAPTPVFVTWVLALEGQYVRAAAVGGGALCFLVLTGDAGLVATLLGVVAAGAMVGLGDVMDRARSVATMESLLVVLGVMVVTPFVFSVVPGGAAGPLGFLGGDTVTMEQNVVSADENLEIVGSVEQTSEVRFVVSGDEPRYWRTGSYDRYTGDGWIRTGESRSSIDALPSPDRTGVATYSVRTRTAVSALPAPWQPVGLDGVEGVSVQSDGTPTLDGGLGSGEGYTVNSTVPEASPAELAAADGNYPDGIEQRYTQLPTGTSDRVAQRTRSIAVNADTPYETATVVEAWLGNNREYSLDVNRPDGDIVEAFLFEMERGYCTYYATTMVGMLRSVDVPARLAVGYTTGESLGEDTWAVRGTNSHAWVEVYIPEHGWVQFDPTPADPRSEAEEQAIANPATGTDLDLSAVDEGGDDDAQLDGIEPGNPDGTDPANETTTDNRTNGTDNPRLAGRAGLEFNTPDSSPANTSQNVTANETGNTTDNATGENTDEGGENRPQVSPGEIDPRDGGDALLELPAYQHVLLATLALAGLAVGVRRSPIPDVVGREFAIRFQRRHDPTTDIERAHERLLLVLARRHRPRRTGETTRQYLDAIDAGPEARRLAAIRERARYAGEHSVDDADEAVDLVEQVRNS